MQRSYMTIDLQYGSTGKGLLAGWLAMQQKPDVVVTAWGPNSGHTFVAANGRKYVHRMLANGVVSPGLEAVLIGPGSVVDPAVLLTEITSCADHLMGKRVIIHPNAAVVNEGHVAQEQANVKIGSTMKGTGAAVIQKIRRDPDDSNIARDAFPRAVCQAARLLGCSLEISKDAYESVLDDAHVVQIEGAQGYSLSINSGMYPYCTGRDVNPWQILNDCAMPGSVIPYIYGTLRTYPIRVSNRFDESGRMVGTSGDCYGDQVELDWEAIGQQPEFTTVTGLQRRLFSFSYQQLREALRACRPDSLFLNFTNYMGEGELDPLIAKINEAAGPKTRVDYIGIGPNADDVLEVDTSEVAVAQAQEEGEAA